MKMFPVAFLSFAKHIIWHVAKSYKTSVVEENASCFVQMNVLNMLCFH